MEEIVQCFEIFKTIFYFKFSELGKDLFGSEEIWINLNWFEIV
jgi:hypothetical protein